MGVTLKARKSYSPVRFLLLSPRPARDIRPNAAASTEMEAADPEPQTTGWDTVKPFAYVPT